MSVNMTIQPTPWAQAFQVPLVSAEDAKAAAVAERAEQERQAQAAEEARHEHCGTFHHGSCAADTYMRAEIARLQAELAAMTVDRDHWHMKATHNDIRLQTFARQRAALLAELRQDAEAQHTTTTAHAA